jgi:hypothetical protein
MKLLFLEVQLTLSRLFTKLEKTLRAWEAPSWFWASSLAPVLTTAATRLTGLWFSRVATFKPLEDVLTRTASGARTTLGAAALAWAALEAQRLREDNICVGEMRINADEFWSGTGHRLTLTIVDETEDMTASFSTIVFFL